MVQVEEEKKDEEKVIVKESVDKKVEEVVNAKNPAPCFVIPICKSRSLAGVFLPDMHQVL